MFRTFLGDVNPQKLPSRRLQTLWERKNRVLLEEYYIFDVVIPLEVEFASDQQSLLIGFIILDLQGLLLPRFSGPSRGSQRTFLAEREGGVSLGDPPGPSGILPRVSLEAVPPPRFFGLSWETSTLKNCRPEDSKRSGSGRIEFSSKSTTFLM